MGNATKRVAIISPYLDILGGGERYLLTIAEILAEQHEVFVFWNNQKIIAQAEKKLGINLQKVKFISVPKSRYQLYKILSDFEFLFYMTDGSLFFPASKNNFLIVQSSAHCPKKTLLNILKLSRYKQIICYSEYISNQIDLILKKKAFVLFPPVSVDIFKPIKKTDLIISVGRFFSHLHSKKQEILLEGFNNLIKKCKLEDWKLILIGSVDPGEVKYFDIIKKIAHPLPVEIYTQVDLRLLAQFYGQAKIYWHAAGYGEDLLKFPERAEHFGLTTVEAMAAGCVPIVFNAGGQREIVKENINGYLWTTIEELIGKTSNLVGNESLRERLAKKAVSDSCYYSFANFKSRLLKLL